MVIHSKEKNKAKKEKKGGAVLDGLAKIKHYLILAAWGLGGAWGNWGVTANGYRFLFGVVIIFKIDCGNGHTALCVY